MSSYCNTCDRYACPGCLGAAWDRIKQLRSELQAAIVRAEAAETLILLFETCSACTAELHGPESDLENGAPHCYDCSPTDEQREKWLNEVISARGKTPY